MGFTFLEYEKGSAPTPSTPSVTIQRRGLMSINRASYEGLGKPEGVVLLWDPDKRVTLTNDLLKHGADYTPYEGLDIRGWPVQMLLGGRTIVKDVELTGPESRGRYLPRNRSSLTSSRGST